MKRLKINPIDKKNNNNRIKDKNKNNNNNKFVPVLEPFSWLKAFYMMNEDCLVVLIHSYHSHIHPNLILYSTIFL